ncbi:MAG: sodium:calcium antiporter [Gemmatimonadetes bacterium]|nr:sodium:calcium antiporter [Gemmatimonadota bacterium]
MLLDPWIVFILSGAAVAGAGVRLARDGDAIAATTGLGGLWVGAILVAAATSLPELSTDISAVLQGNPTLAVGDLMGSNMANMAILAVADLASFRTRILTRVAINQALVGLLSIGLTAIAAAGILAGARFSLLGLTWPTLAIGFTYLAGMRLLHHNRPAPPFRRPEEVEEARAHTRPLRWAIAGLVISAMVILIAAPYLARSAATLAERLGVSQGFVGLLLLAVATSLPEVAVSIESMRMGSYDLAVGNLLGSNCFNMAALVVLDAVGGAGPLLASGDATLLIGAVFGILMTALALLDVLNKSEKRVWVVEPGPAFILLAYAAGVYLAYRT